MAVTLRKEYDRRYAGLTSIYCSIMTRSLFRSPRFRQAQVLLPPVSLIPRSHLALHVLSRSMGFECLGTLVVIERAGIKVRFPAI